MKTKLIKTLAVANVLLIAGWLMADVTLHPAPPPHPDAVPDITHPVPGTDVHPGVMNLAASGSIYDSATACWSFNDPTDLGNDDCADTYDLTEVNTPTATGGALGYVADFDGSNQRAENTSTSPNSANTDFSLCAWVRPESLGATQSIAGAWADWLIRVASGDVTYFTNSIQAGSGTTLLVAGQRNFVCVAANDNGVSTDVAYFLDGAADGTGNAATRMPAATTGWAVAAFAEGNTQYFDGLIGPVYVFGAKAVVAADALALYNSGKGMPCSDAVSTVSGMTNCYDMTEDGGPYVDSVGSNDLTGVNTPTRKAGLVEQSDSGMSVNLVGGSSQYLTNASVSLWPHPSVSSSTVSLWINTTDAGTGIIGQYSASADSILVFLSGGVPQGLLYTTPSGQNFGPLSGAINDGQWHNLVVSYDTATGNLTGFLDGGSGTVAVTDAAANFGTEWATTFSIGEYAGSNFITGQIDDPAIWAGTPGDGTAPSVATLYNSGAGTFYAAYWDAYFSGDPIRFAWSQRPKIRRVQ